MRSHGSARSCRRGTGTTARRTAGSVPVTMSGSLGLLTQLTARAVVIPAAAGSGAATPFSADGTTPGIAPDLGQTGLRAWSPSFKALFPGRSPRRRVTSSSPFSSAHHFAGMRMEMWGILPRTRRRRVCDSRSPSRGRRFKSGHPDQLRRYVTCIRLAAGPIALTGGRLTLNGERARIPLGHLLDAFADQSPARGPSKLPGVGGWRAEGQPSYAVRIVLVGRCRGGDRAG